MSSLDIILPLFGFGIPRRGGARRLDGIFSVWLRERRLKYTKYFCASRTSPYEKSARPSIRYRPRSGRLSFGVPVGARRLGGVFSAMLPLPFRRRTPEFFIAFYNLHT